MERSKAPAVFVVLKSNMELPLSGAITLDCVVFDYRVSLTGHSKLAEEARALVG